MVKETLVMCFYEMHGLSDLFQWGDFLDVLNHNCNFNWLEYFGSIGVKLKVGA